MGRAQRNPSCLGTEQALDGFRLRSTHPTSLRWIGGVVSPCMPICPSGKTPPSPVNPSHQKYSTLPKFGIAAFSRHPGPRRGAIVRRSERGSGCGGRGCVGHAKAGPGRDEPREVGRRADGRRSQRTAKPCGPDRRCYGQALRRWLWARPGLETSPIREATEARRNSAPGRAGISRQTTAQGRPGVSGPPVVPSAHLRVQIFAQRIMGASRHPVFPAPSSRKRDKERAKLGHLEPRECRSVRD